MCQTNISVTYVNNEAGIFYILDNAENYRCKIFSESLVEYIMLKNNKADSVDICYLPIN